MLKWIAILSTIAVLSYVQLKLDLVRVANEALKSKLQSIHMMHVSSQATTTLNIASSAFAPGASIPPSYTCDGAQVNPPLSISGVPTGAQSLVLIMDDPDVPKQIKSDGVFDHWVLFNIPATTTQIQTGSMPGVSGANGSGKNAYTVPCPPKQYEPSEHRYFFRLYALDTMLSLPVGASKVQVLLAMGGHVLAEAELMGRYKRP